MIGGAASTATAQTSITAALTGGAGVGDVVMFLASIGSGKVATLPTDTQSNTWNLIAQPNSGTDSDLNVWYSVITNPLTTADTITTTWTGTVARRAWDVINIPGLAASPLDLSVSATALSATSVSLSTSPSSTAQADEIVIAAYGWHQNTVTTNAVMSADAGYTMLDQQLAGGGGSNQIGVGVEWLETSSAGVQAAAPTMNETCASICGVLATFKVAAGGGGGGPTLRELMLLGVGL